MVGVLEVFFGAYRPCIDFGQAFTFDARLSNEMDLVATFEDARISNSMIGKETGEDGKNTRSCLSLNSPNRNNGSFDHFNHRTFNTVMSVDVGNSLKGLRFFRSRHYPAVMYTSVYSVNRYKLWTYAGTSMQFQNVQYTRPHIYLYGLLL